MRDVMLEQLSVPDPETQAYALAFYDKLLELTHSEPPPSTNHILTEAEHLAFEQAVISVQAAELVLEMQEEQEQEAAEAGANLEWDQPVPGPDRLPELEELDPDIEDGYPGSRERWLSNAKVYEDTHDATYRGIRVYQILLDEAQESAEKAAASIDLATGVAPIEVVVRRAHTPPVQPDGAGESESKSKSASKDVSASESISTSKSLEEMLAQLEELQAAIRKVAESQKQTIRERRVIKDVKTGTGLPLTETEQLAVQFVEWVVNQVDSLVYETPFSFQYVWKPQRLCKAGLETQARALEQLNQSGELSIQEDRACVSILWFQLAPALEQWVAREAPRAASGRVRVESIKRVLPILPGWLGPARRAHAEFGQPAKTTLYMHGLDLLDMFKNQIQVPTNLLSTFLPTDRISVIDHPVLVRHRAGSLRHEIVARAL